MNEEIKEIFNKYGKSNYNDNYCLEFKTYIIELKELKILYDYITSLQEENQKLNKIIDELEKILKDVPNNDASNWQYGRESLAEDILDELTELKKEVE